MSDPSLSMKPTLRSSSSVNPGLGFGAFTTAQRTIQGDEVMHMMRKGQIAGITKRNVLAQNEVINRLCGLAA